MTHAQAGKPTPKLLVNQYDALGRVTSQTDQLNRVTTYDYTSVPGSTKTTDPAGNTVLDTYRSGLRLSTTAGYGTGQATTTTFRYDPSSLGVTAIVDAHNHTLNAQYDREGNQIRVADPLDELPNRPSTPSTSRSRSRPPKALPTR